MPSRRWARLAGAVALCVLLCALALSLTARSSILASPASPAPSGAAEQANPGTRSQRRVVSLCSAATETLLALGLSNCLVGVDQHAAAGVARQVPIVATDGTLSSERLVALRPTVAFAWWYQRGAIERMQQLGVPVVPLRAQGADDAVRLVEQVGLACGAADQGGALARRLRQELDGLEQAAQRSAAGRPLVYIELQSPFRSCGPGSYGHDLVIRAGGRNLAGRADTAYPVLSSEVILAAQPDVIVLVKAAGSPQEDVGTRPGWSALRAIVNRRVHVVPSDLLSPGPRVVEAVCSLRRLLYPDKGN